MPQVPRNLDLLKAARALRREMTPQERRLWYGFLRHYPVKVYKQRPIDRYIADFYCASARLVIEVDGAQHYTPDGRAYDEMRTEAIQRYGLKVVRFSNYEVDHSFEAVCDQIRFLIGNDEASGFSSAPPKDGK